MGKNAKKDKITEELSAFDKYEDYMVACNSKVVTPTAKKRKTKISNPTTASKKSTCSKKNATKKGNDQSTPDTGEQKNQ